MNPESGRSRPARQRKVVVLPQPEGPNRTDTDDWPAGFCQSQWMRRRLGIVFRTGPPGVQSCRDRSPLEEKNEAECQETECHQSQRSSTGSSVIKGLHIVENRNRQDALRTGILPPIMSTTPNSPTAWAKVSTIPANKPGQANGKTMRRQVSKRDTPRHQDASTKRWSMPAKAAPNGRTAKGTLKISVPTRIPANEKGGAVDRRLPYRFGQEGYGAPCSTADKSPKLLAA